ncbi:MAG: hypothetical protein FJW26_18535 [Acidimicrobiia bacterium]|nr:hypothetical protein [Acidimicrobiia bacterium]
MNVLGSMLISYGRNSSRKSRLLADSRVAVSAAAPFAHSLVIAKLDKTDLNRWVAEAVAAPVRERCKAVRNRFEE